MYYKEFLRVRNCFAVFAIVLGSLAVLVYLLSGSPNVTFDMAAAAPAPHHVLASVKSTPSSDTVMGPGIVISTDTKRAPYTVLLALAGFVAAIFGTVLGTVLAAENCGHLDIAWTRPAPRLAYAARLMAVDVIGILAMVAFTLVLSLALIFARGWQHYMSFDAADGWVVGARFALYPLAWFALVAALTASVREKAGGIIAGLSWLGASILVLLASVPMAPVMHQIIAVINFFNPMLYGSYSTGPEATRHFLLITPAVSIIGLTSIIVLGIIAALAQWRRLEA